MKYKRLLVLCFFLLTVAASAQTITSSPYSVFGIGVLKERTSAYNRALAETGIGVRDNLYLNNLNPASYSAISGISHTSEFGLYAERNKITNNEQSEVNTTGNLSALNFFVKLKPWWGATIGVSPYSVVNYNITTTKNFDEIENASVRYSGQGGLTQFYFGNGMQINKNLSVGFNLGYLHGSIKRETEVLDGQFEGIVYSRSTYLHKTFIDYGAQYAFFLKNNNMLSIGATYSDRLKMSTSQRSYLVNSTDSVFTNSQNVRDYWLPRQLAFGVAYQSRLHVLAADLKIKKWSNAVLDTDVKLQDVNRVSFGYEYKGKQLPTKPGSFISYRAGVYVQNSYLKINGRTYNEYGFSLGTGLPLNGNFGVLNLSYNYNLLGTTRSKLIYQNAHVVVIDITLRDIWGIRRRFE